MTQVNLTNEEDLNQLKEIIRKEKFIVEGLEIKIIRDGSIKKIGLIDIYGNQIIFTHSLHKINRLETFLRKKYGIKSSFVNVPDYKINKARALAIDLLNKELGKNNLPFDINNFSLYKNGEQVGFFVGNVLAIKNIHTVLQQFPHLKKILELNNFFCASLGEMMLIIRY